MLSSGGAALLKRRPDRRSARGPEGVPVRCPARTPRPLPAVAAGSGLSTRLSPGRPWRTGRTSGRSRPRCADARS
ncbi:hypothetical protein CP981_26215 [Streptomyces platensis]|uniref:Uncharacterized protein n=1 Tax=Streptomyces platensis TaxID=58346 RepID=A0AAE6TRU2_STRPT|nr:hypothetical protein CP981_26215 [Streptomyces platensis]